MENLNNIHGIIKSLKLCLDTCDSNFIILQSHQWPLPMNQVCPWIIMDPLLDLYIFFSLEILLLCSAYLSSLASQ